MNCLIGLRDPFPLAENCHFVAQNKSIFILDDKGNMEKIHEDSEIVHDPRALAPRAKEPTLANRTDLEKDTGHFIVTDVYESRKMNGVKRGTIKKLLIMEDLPKNASRHGWRGEHGGHISLHRILGEVPVEPDGSAYFEVPALRALFFVALDEKGLAVKRMQNFTQVMPGEVQGCVGCHEKRSTPSLKVKKYGVTMALKRPPSKIVPIKGVPEVYRYLRDVQPIFDKYCTDCHSQNKAAGKMILTGEWTEWHTVSYDRLYEFDQISRATPWKENGNHDSYEFGTFASPLLKKVDGSHHDVKITPEEWDMLRCWIESGAHYTGTYATHNNFENQVGAKFAIYSGENVGESGLTAFNFFNKPALAEPMEQVAKRRCYSCHENMYKLGRLRREQRSFNKFVNGCPPDSLNNPNYSLTLFNLTNPDNSLFLRAPLAKDAGGYNWCKDKNGAPFAVFKNKNDPDYKLVREEIDKTVERQKKYGRIEMPNYQPKEYYVYWMKRFGILPQEFKGDVDFYKLDRSYWESLWWTPKK